MTNLNKNGSHFIADSTIIPLLDHNGNIKEYMAIHNDITDRVELKRELFEKEQMHEKEERIKEAQKSFLVVFTHELKTPLNAIINFSKYVKKQMHSPEKINYNKCSTLLDSVLSNASDMLDNITQILEISKLNSGKLTYTHTLFNANEIIEHTIRKFDSLLESNNIKLTFETKNEAFIYSDELRVKQIISNILSNAIKYGKGKISVIVFRNSLITEISITDNGPGIRDKESIFNLYTQEDEGLLDRKGKGTGIGLYFLKLLCQDLHINYKVEDAEVDSGTRFTLTFKNKPIKG